MPCVFTKCNYLHSINTRPENTSLFIGKRSLFFCDTFALKHLTYINRLKMFFLVASQALVSQQNKHSPDGNNRKIRFHAIIGFFRVTIEEKNSLNWSRNADMKDFLLCASLPSFIPIPYLQGDLIYKYPIIPVLSLPSLVF